MNAITKSNRTDQTRFNAVRHGILSRHLLLPWEDADEYNELFAALHAEHRPKGPTEDHLVEELAGILWRKRRLRMAEAAAHQQGLLKTTIGFYNTDKAALVLVSTEDQAASVAEALHCSDEDAAYDNAVLNREQVGVRVALAALQDAGPDGGYEAALARLQPEVRSWWEELLDESNTVSGYRPDTDGLYQFLIEGAGPDISRRIQTLKHRPQLRRQAYAESLDPARMEKLARYEVHLDRKLERTLSMLLKLQDLRQGGDEG